MKKIQYIAPSIKVANIQLQSLLADSLGINEGSVSVGLSKRGSFMDDDDEDF